ncbi:unnamed protein product [Dibothriocephalus latus]|uniref:Choline/carnitine acyltransferase domain-containing protein n=1 Tax=Dibothriocephalus latus TaxID=60516 RepID=A0A3P7LW33_DIBLA|nr:unnamed protein product [Dibothriocephalus latus]
MPKNIDASVKIWAYSLKLLQGRKPRLYSYQGSLPSLPLPSLSETLERVTDWWEEYVYLSNRAPLMSNSNYYGLDTMCQVVGNPTQAARAAFIAYHCLQIRHAIYLGEMEPIMLHGIVPLCSLQYERQFNTTRIPQTGEDVIKHWTTSDHFAVYHHGRYFKCPFTVEGRYLLPAELEAMFESILGDVSEPAPGEELLGALTAGPRDDWATARKSFFSSGVNRISLNAIEKVRRVAFLALPFHHSESTSAQLGVAVEALLAQNTLTAHPPSPREDMGIGRLPTPTGDLELNSIGSKYVSYQNLNPYFPWHLARSRMYCGWFLCLYESR